jgi:hypothetical protein
MQGSCYYVYDLALRLLLSIRLGENSELYSLIVVLLSQARVEPWHMEYVL